MTIKELKAKKQAAVIRRDNNFKSDAEKQAEFESKIRADGWKISGYILEADGIRYSLFKNEPEVHKWYCKPEDEKRIKESAYNYMKRWSLSISKEYRDGDFLVIETPITRINRYLPLNRPEMKRAEISGVLVIRSKDYVFFFTDENGIRHELYGTQLKKEMITAEGIHYENERGVNLDYIFQE